MGRSHFQRFPMHMHPQQALVDSISCAVRAKLEGEGSGHDWWHIVRVRRMAFRIGEREGADVFIVELAALLHDIADWKFYDGDEAIGPATARSMLAEHAVPIEIIDHVCDIIATMSFKGAGVKTEMRTLEGMVVQDADRLDAIGTIGIARAFAYGGSKHRPLHDPEKAPVMHVSKEAYFNNVGTTVNHFYEKLLLLKDRMNTGSARQIAESRHAFMEEYLKKFLREWEGAE